MLTNNNLPLPRSYLLEHGLTPDGHVNKDAGDIGDVGSYNTFFGETSGGKYVPRALFMDLDPSVCSWFG